MQEIKKKVDTHERRSRWEKTLSDFYSLKKKKKPGVADNEWVGRNGTIL
jgi:hypothetical protein